MQSFIISLKEGLEAFLLIFLMLKETSNKKPIFYGVILGIVLSCVIGISIEQFRISFDSIEPYFKLTVETILVISLISSLIYFKKSDFNSKAASTGLLFISMFIILREGVEIVLFQFTSESNSLIFILLGILVSIIISKIFISGLRINIKMLFNIINVYLILLTGYLIGHIVKDLYDLHFLNLFSFYIYDLSKTFLNSKTNVVGYLIHILTGFYYKPLIMSFIVQYISTTIMIYSYFKIRTNKSIKKI